MDRSHAILEVLADGHFHSGEILAKSLGVTRAAVWKKVQALEKLGLSVFRVPGKGYRLADPLQLLDAAAIAAALSPECRAALKGVTVLDTVDSTNSWVAARNADPEVCFAEFQSAGRGRRGRSWVSPFGANLYMSMSWRFDEWPAGFTALGMVTAIAAVRALDSLGIRGVRIKWPNDLVAADRKLGGVLIDVQGEPPRATRAVIGLGLNVRMPARSAEQIDQPWMDLATLADGQPPERNAIAAALVESLFDAMQDFAARGFAAFSADWQALDLVSGRTVALHSHDQTVTGVAAGVDAEGALLLKTPQGLKRFVSGDISLRIAGMILLLDIGNTRIKWARLESGVLGRMDGRVHADEQLPQAIEAAFEGPKPSRILMCNVAGPLVSKSISDYCQEHFKLNPEILISSAERCGVKSGYTDPVRLGADRWAAIIGAYTRFGGPLCVMDAGTAITVDAVDALGQHQGGLIAPGPQTMRRALADATAGLGNLGEGELALLAKDTRSAIWSGGWHTAAGFLDRMHTLIAKELGPKTQFLLTGGDGPRLHQLLPGKFSLVPELVLLGLAAIAEPKL